MLLLPFIIVRSFLSFLFFFVCFFAVLFSFVLSFYSHILVSLPIIFCTPFLFAVLRITRSNVEKNALRALVFYGKRYASSENTISLKRMSGFWQDRFLTKSRLPRGMEEIKRGQILPSFVPGMRCRKEVVFLKLLNFTIGIHFSQITE